MTFTASEDLPKPFRDPTQLPELDRTFVKKIYKHPQSIILHNS